jgi:predicted RNA methylase
MVQKAIEQRKKNKKFSIIAQDFKEVKKLMERYSSRIDYLFSKTNPKVRERLKLDDTAMYSVTDEITADEITALMVERIGNNKSLAIVDATACVGGNLFSFARHYTKVLGVEIDNERYEILRHNWNVIFGQHKEKFTGNSGRRTVEFIHGCCVELLKKRLPEERHPFFQEDHVLFFDPPWGGVNYKSSAILETLTLSNTPLIDVISMAFSRSRTCKAVVCKVPYNYDIEKFRKEDYSLFSLSKKVKLLIFHGFTGKVDSRKRKFDHTSNDANGSNDSKGMIRVPKLKRKKKGISRKSY